MTRTAAAVFRVVRAPERERHAGQVDGHRGRHKAVPYGIPFRMRFLFRGAIRSLGWAKPLRKCFPIRHVRSHAGSIGFCCVEDESALDVTLTGARGRT